MLNNRLTLLRPLACSFTRLLPGLNGNESMHCGEIYEITHCRAVHSGGAKGAVAPARKTKCFFSNIVSDFAGLFLVAILVRNLTKTEFAPADKKS